jgi:hypothetical protein
MQTFYLSTEKSGLRNTVLDALHAALYNVHETRVSTAAYSAGGRCVHVPGQTLYQKKRHPEWISSCFSPEPSVYHWHSTLKSLTGECHNLKTDLPTESRQSAGPSEQLAHRHHESHAFCMPPRTHREACWKRRQLSCMYYCSMLLLCHELLPAHSLSLTKNSYPFDKLFTRF